MSQFQLPACRDLYYIRPVLLELGGKNALIAYPDADPAAVARAAVAA